MRVLFVFFFFFNDTATTEIYTLSLHDALPICSSARDGSVPVARSFLRPSLFSLHFRAAASRFRSEEHTSELQSRSDLVCRLLLEKKKIHVFVCLGFTLHLITVLSALVSLM